ncbi:UNVERIFIED_CONTAM: hypothetical protein HDU68_001474 [Siphonaria sp. JEL0065]|nr:hypothetical protein HDU68_001474 [Siphonaria sp. JEL0065]
MSTITKRLSNFFNRPAAPKSESPTPSTVSEGKEPEDAKTHGSHHHNPAANMMEKLMGAPFRLVVAGDRGSGATSLVDRVFGVAIKDTCVVETLSMQQLEAVEAPKKKKPVEFVVVSRLNSETIQEETVDLAWLVVAGGFEAHLVDSVQLVFAANIPLLVVLSKSDLRSEEESARILSDVEILFGKLGAVRGLQYDVVETSNSPGPICSDCNSKSILKKHASGSFNGFYCSNEQCDLSTNAFKIDTTPISAPNPLLPLVHTTRKLLLAHPATNTNSNSASSNDAPVGSVEASASNNAAATDNTDNDVQQNNGNTSNNNTANTNTTSNNGTISNRRFQIAQLVDVTPKFEYAKVFVITSTLLAAGFGANPIPFIDAPLLVATEWALLNSICQVYGLENRSTYWGLFKNIMATPMIGLMGADVMKLIPGFGTVVGGVIDVVICATLTLSLGVAVTRMCAASIDARNARAFGVGEGRPFFTMDAEVGAMFKEVYNGSKEAIKGMLKSGTLSKEGLMNMVQSQSGVEGGSEVDVGAKEADEMEQLANEMMHSAAAAEKKGKVAEE